MDQPGKPSEEVFYKSQSFWVTIGFLVLIPLVLLRMGWFFPLLAIILLVLGGITFVCAGGYSFVGAKDFWPRKTANNSRASESLLCGSVGFFFAGVFLSWPLYFWLKVDRWETFIVCVVLAVIVFVPACEAERQKKLEKRKPWPFHSSSGW